MNMSDCWLRMKMGFWPNSAEEWSEPGVAHVMPGGTPRAWSEPGRSENCDPGKVGGMKQRERKYWKNARD